VSAVTIIAIDLILRVFHPDGARGEQAIVLCKSFHGLAKTLNGLFKATVILRRGPWRSFNAVEYRRLEWMD
jgi:hypothetical protein